MTPASSRDTQLDGLKLLLIVLVTFGHLLGKTVSQEPTGQTLHTLIYAFHMPLFVLLSGYFSKATPWEKLHRQCLRLLETYVWLSLFLCYFVDGSLRALYAPYASNWYLLSLIGWKYLHAALSRLLPPWQELFAAFLLAFLVFTFVNEQTSVLSVMRTTSFFPFFVVGTLLPADFRRHLHRRFLLLPLAAAGVCLLLSHRSFALNLLEFQMVGIRPLMRYWPGTEVEILSLKAVYYLTVFVLCAAVAGWAPLFRRLNRYGSRTLPVYVLQGMTTHLLVHHFDLPLWASLLLTAVIVGVGVFIGGREERNWLATPLHTLWQRTRCSREKDN